MDFTSLTVFLQAAVIGVLIAAPAGPIGLLTMQRTLERGLAAGLATGLGAAADDAVYGAVGAFSVRWLIDGLTQAKTPLALGGGALLLVLAWRTWHAPVAHSAAPARDARGLLGLAAGTFALTLANPATIVSFHCGVWVAGGRPAQLAVAVVDGGGRAGGLCGVVAAADQRHRLAAAALHARLAPAHQPGIGPAAGRVCAVAVGAAGLSLLPPPGGPAKVLTLRCQQRTRTIQASYPPILS